MDNKIKTLTFLALTICSLFLTGCKQNNWLDWKTQNDLWLENNKRQANVQVTSTGLQYQIIADPTPQDARPNATSTIVCDYTLKLINGYVVQSANNASLYLPSSVPGFAEGCHKIHNNGDIILYVPAYLGYDYEKYQTGSYGSAEGLGTEGTQLYIPPYSTLIFTVHLCSVTGN